MPQWVLASVAFFRSILLLLILLSQSPIAAPEGWCADPSSRSLIVKLKDVPAAIQITLERSESVAPPQEHGAAEATTSFGKGLRQFSASR